MTYNRPTGLFFALSRYYMKGGTKMAVAEIQDQVYVFKAYAIAVMLALHRWQTPWGYLSPFLEIRLSN